MSKDDISSRKDDGINIVSEENVESKLVSTYFEYVHLIHNALPELDFNKINTKTKFLDKEFSMPLIIGSMTGGSQTAKKINHVLSLAAEKFNIPMGLGSQRAGLLLKDLAKTYSIARESAKSIFLIANIGGAQLAKGLTLKDAENCIKMIKANALTIHLNPLQELVQPEGDYNYEGVLLKIEEFSKKLSVPVIVKEVGSGISKEVAVRLKLVGVKSIDVAGVGGTSWAGVEGIRARQQKNSLKYELGELFWDWGIPTAASLLEVVNNIDLPVISSGGIRNGLDVAKSIALGANMCAMASPFLKHALISKNSLYDFITMTNHVLKSTMFLVGVDTVEKLQNTRYVLSGPLFNWKKALDDLS
jgi:isopentenyl-diphosphate delta-isomerase